GTTKGQMVQVNLTASTDLRSVKEFKNLVIKQQGGAIVRLDDVANVTLGAEDYDSEVGFDGKKAVYIGISVAPAANLLDVIARVRNVFPGIKAQLPQGLQGEIVYDSTKFVNSAIDEVISTLAQALVIVTLVVFAFLGSIRSVVIPTVAIPLSLVGTFTLMFALGYSINLLTLLALVLGDRKSTRLNSSHEWISYAVFCLKKKKKTYIGTECSPPEHPLDTRQHALRGRCEQQRDRRGEWTRHGQRQAHNDSLRLVRKTFGY